MPPLEIEVKVRMKEGAGAARQALLAVGAVEVRARHFEENRILDTPGFALASRAALLRIRSTSDGQDVLTFKEKVGDDTRAKIRREWETRVGSASVLGAILERAGFVPTYRYQKHRTVYRLGEAVLDLDETPMGCFLEIEGSETSIAETMRRLGLGDADRIVEDYRTLWHAWLAGRGLPPADMLFPEPGGGGPEGPR